MTAAIQKYLWLCFLLVGLGLAGLYNFMPETARYIAYYAVAICAVIALAGVAVRRKPAQRLPWIVLTIALALSVIADITWDSYGLLLDRDAPNPSVADPLYIMGFLTAISAFMIWSRRISTGRGREHSVDAAIVALGFAVLSWVFVIEPRVQDPEVGIAGQMVSLSYPILDLFLLAILVRLLMRPQGTRQRALLLFAAGTMAIIFSDALYSWGELTASYSAIESIANVGWLLWYVFWGAAGLDPSMRKIEEEALRCPMPATDLTRQRFALLTGAALLAPTSLLIESLSGSSLNAIVIATGTATLFALVIYRMRLIVRSLESALGRQARLQEELHHTAFHDSLTGLANRANLNLRLDHLLSEEQHPNFALLFLDLDNFKDVNDRFGHAAGDQLLISVANRLRASVRSRDTVSRLGGDEFLIMLDLGAESPGELAVATAERILETLMAPISIGSERVTIGTSIGIAWPAAGTQSRDVLLRAADRAMYDAKRAGKNRYGIAPTLLDAPAEGRGGDARDEEFLGTQLPEFNLRPGASLPRSA